MEHSGWTLLIQLFPTQAVLHLVFSMSQVLHLQVDLHAESKLKQENRCCRSAHLLSV